MGWVRFLLAAAALPALIGGFWLIFTWQGQSPDTPEPFRILAVEAPSSCEYLQAMAIDRTRSANRDLEDAPDFAFAAASDAYLSAELARQVCDPASWVDSKILQRPLELQMTAYGQLSDQPFSVLQNACEHLSNGLMADDDFLAVLNASAQEDFALQLSQSARNYVCAGARGATPVSDREM